MLHDRSISSLASSNFIFERSLWLTVWAPMVWPALATSQDLGVAARNFPDREEGGLGALRLERGEDCGCAPGQRPVVEREHDLFGVQEVVRLVVLKAEAGAACGVDLDD